MCLVGAKICALESESTQNLHPSCSRFQNACMVRKHARIS
eukprot:UN06813